MLPDIRLFVVMFYFDLSSVADLHNASWSTAPCSLTLLALARGTFEALSNGICEGY